MPQTDPSHNAGHQRAPGEPVITGGIPERGELEYDLSDWSHEGRSMLDRVLTAEEVPHAWQGGVLVVRTADEEAVDDLVDEVQVAALPTLDPTAERVVYEVTEWSDSAKYTLAERLDGLGVAWEWDEMGDLVVGAPDERAVDGVVDAVTPDVEPSSGGPDDLPSGPELIGDLFVAADRLRRNARDPSATVSVLEKGPLLADMGLPYGYDPDFWARVVRDGERLAALLEPDRDRRGPDDDEAVIEAAEAYRDLLRDHV